MIAIAAILFLFGTVLGSFATVLAHRLPRGENWVSGRSKCPACGAQIKARDNVPVLGWLLLRGRCRACGERISSRYPLTELGLGVLFAATYLILGDDDWGEVALGLVLCFVLVVITLTDLELKIIPNKVVLPGALAAIAIAAASDLDSMPERLLAAAIAGMVLFLIAFAYPRGMGLGDVKLVAMMGLYLGKAVAPAVLIGFAVGAIVGVALIAGGRDRKNAIPFGPFLALGGVIALWFGNAMVDAYVDHFFPGN